MVTTVALKVSRIVVLIVNIASLLTGYAQRSAMEALGATALPMPNKERARMLECDGAQWRVMKPLGFEPFPRSSPRRIHDQ